MVIVEKKKQGKMRNLKCKSLKDRKVSKERKTIPGFSYGALRNTSLQND